MTTVTDAGTDMADAVAMVHAESWKVTYRGIMSDDYLDNEVDEERTRYWRDAMSAGSYAVIKVVRDGARIVGFAGLRKDPDDEGYDCTLEHLHLLPEVKGKGLGKKLMAAAALQVQQNGGASLCLWVFEDNKRAIGFYQRLGGQTDAHGMDEMAGKPDRRIGWHDLDALVAACEDRP